MAKLPVFPEFKPLELADREVVQRILWGYQPETSELTFTNLFIWRDHYGYQWSLDGDWLLILGNSPGAGRWALPPVGPPARVEVSRKLLEWLQENGEKDPRFERADKRLVSELAGVPGFAAEAVRDQFDYVYQTSDLIHLAGGEYHAKRNYINTFKRSYAYSYEPMREEHLAGCLGLAESWCRMRRCNEDLNLMGEWEAVREALKNFSALELQGGVIFVDGRVEALTLGEKLNEETAVIHLEKANPEIRGLYAVINQQFCENAWADVPFINREQDLGEPGLRTAKLSYHPHHLVEKFRIRLS
jgi:hypothetical protein